MSYYDNFKLLQTTKTNEELIRDYKNGDKEAINKLILKNMKFIQYMVSLHKNSSIYYDDLVEYGIIGLTKAINTFDETKNIQFTTYASFWINREINIFLNRESLQITIPFNSYYLLKILKNLEQNYKYKYGKNPSDEELLDEYKKLNYKTPATVSKIKNLRMWFKPSISLNDFLNLYQDDNKENTFISKLNGLEDKNSIFSDSSINQIIYEKIRLIINGEIPSTLTEKQRLIIDYYFGFNHERINTVKIAEKLNVCKQNVSNSLRISLQKLKKTFLENQIITEEEYEVIKDKKIKIH